MFTGDDTCDFVQELGFSRRPQMLALLSNAAYLNPGEKN
jgi:hypothetical protein